MLEILLAEESSVAVGLQCGTLSCSEACLFLSDDLLRLRLQFVQYYLQHVFVWTADEADRSVVLALLQVAFLKSVMTKDWVHRFGHSPVCQILLQIVVRVVITSCPPAWTSSAWMLSTPADFPFFSDCTAASTSLRRMGRLHLNTHTPLTQRSRSGLTMPLSRHNVGTYQETSSHAPRQGTLGYSRLRSLSHCGHKEWN